MEKHSDSPKLRSNPFEDGEGGSYELREVALKGSPKPAHNQTSNGYYLQAQDGNGDSNFDLHLDEDPLQLHYDGEREEEDEKEDDGNDDFDVITIEEGHRKHGAPMTLDEEAQYRSWVRWAIIVSWASVVIDLAFGFISLFIAIADKSVGIFGFSLENFLDVVTSLLIIWRFGGFSREELVVGDPVYDDKMEKREQRAEVLIALLFVLLGGLTCLIALIVLYEKESPDDVIAVIIVAAVSIVVLAVLAVAKFRLATALHSQAFRQDAWVTTISCILSVGLLAGSVIYHIDNDIWFIDCLVALPLGGALLIYGLKTLCTRQWWQPHFWGYYQTNAPIN
ncbi:uncharacterized protein ACA1_368040 [Acanthamoeba castellanii str. Neff]|uniref:Uncharacterized protein n=1 Tax=Acanthamoeba castellanii (strain ATCC 30010 / Neff) TaxID=1257118 RepID=L8H034_ACACF|nr:uncharacterized protein ACA1_368040 [Acanthamoeba castellanii str. Neff]ELR18103.1 hypothetical protein ACA1_368040 [Acanthamoeba castellanii str. Neff]